MFSTNKVDFTKDTLSRDVGFSIFTLDVTDSQSRDYSKSGRYHINMFEVTMQ